MVKNPERLTDFFLYVGVLELPGKAKAEWSGPNGQVIVLHSVSHLAA